MGKGMQSLIDLIAQLDETQIIIFLSKHGLELHLADGVTWEDVISAGYGKDKD